MLKIVLLPAAQKNKAEIIPAVLIDFVLIPCETCQARRLCYEPSFYGHSL